MSRVCQECGCSCNTCFVDDTSLDLHQRIETLESSLRRNNTHISQIEHELIDNKQAAACDIFKLTDELSKLRERYDRLMESHKRLQKVNHSLEDKLLKVVNSFEADKMALQREVASVTSKLVDAKMLVTDLEEENERSRTDCTIAVQLLQCNPANFVSHKLSALPLDLQNRVKKHMTQEEIITCENAEQNEETNIIRVPMATFPPTAMVYSLNNKLNQTENKESNDAYNVPLDLIAKVLSPPERRRKFPKTYRCVKCKSDLLVHDKEIQVCMVNNLSQCTEGLRVHKSTSMGRIRTYSTETDT